MSKYPEKSPSGFTLVELLVSIGILAILSTVMIANYRTSGRQGDLAIAAQKFMSDLRLVQNRALSMLEYNGDLPDSWGIHFDLTQPVSPTSRRSYTVFADRNGDGIMNGGEIDQVFALPARVYIESIAPITGSGRVNFLVKPPDPDMAITNNTGTASYADFIIITLGIDGSTARRRVMVNRFGLVDLLPNP